MIEHILLAGYSQREQKLSVVARASTKLDALKCFLQIAWELKCLDNKKYAALSIPLNEIGKMIGGWQKQLNIKATPEQGSGFFP